MSAMPENRALWAKVAAMNVRECDSLLKEHGWTQVAWSGIGHGKWTHPEHTDKWPTRDAVAYVLESQDPSHEASASERRKRRS